MSESGATTNQVIIFDTTLRDGERSLKGALSLEDKLEVAKQLARLGVDVIEVGYPSGNPLELAELQRLTREIQGPILAVLASAKAIEIDQAWRAVREAAKPRLHVYLSSSDILLKRLFKLTREEGLQRTREMVAYARGYCDDIEFSIHDATRADLDYVCQMAEIAIEAGATTISLPDSAGQAVPAEFERMILTLRATVKNIEQAVIAVHCHNNLGMAVANSLTALRAGAQQVECTVNGIGEPAGNAALEQVVMALAARQDFYNMRTNVKTEELLRTSEMISRFSSISAN